MRRILSVLVFILIMQSLMGCMGTSRNRSPKEWLSLSYSGLAAMDQYAFTGSMSMGMGEGMMFKPQTFEGKIVNHHQLTLQSEQQDPLYRNPVDVLRSLNESHKAIEIIKDGTEESTAAGIIVLRIWDDRNVVKKNWSKKLNEQLDQLAGNHLIAETVGGKEQKIVLEQSKIELNNMLDSLEVDSQYEIIIDKKKLIPLKLEEQTLFSYMRNGNPTKEYRHTNVRFQSFDGSVANDAISPKS
ncbi:hypothetical protein I6N90_03050 [Paenibacillus sp. GSMTC-2017]|uniref:hypothetical protein n=1 Tax=Paenibacillus sp. GSMTC-2017 TaxID=2794350 RepID=UPI0018D6224D|nr:hypothetical protein [Paenibacillus sp. GSMTC-2017]MBH5316788.1 hypothetical protein [Paenibacillus sp. GSMTC-2017]